MKFSLTSMLLAVALVAVAFGWAMSLPRMGERLSLTRDEVVEKQMRATHEAHLEGLLLFVHELSNSPDYARLKVNCATLLIDEFNQLAQASKTSEGDSFEANCAVAGEIIFRLGWDCKTPDQLVAALNDFSRKTGEKNPPVPPIKFLTKVLENKSASERAYEVLAPKKSLTAELDNLD